MVFLAKIFGRGDDRGHLRPVYERIVAAARDSDWYVEGGVADSIDGRFEMMAAMLSLILIRLEREGSLHAADSAKLTEIFVQDMDGQLREIGIGDVVVGKHLGRMMSALGGRLGAYRDALADGNDSALRAALVRNVYRGTPPTAAAIDWLAHEIVVMNDHLRAMEVDRLLAAEGLLR